MVRRDCQNASDSERERADPAWLIPSHFRRSPHIPVARAHNGREETGRKVVTSELRAYGMFLLAFPSRGTTSAWNERRPLSRAALARLAGVRLAIVDFIYAPCQRTRTRSAIRIIAENAFKDAAFSIFTPQNASYLRKKKNVQK